jgi:hypothetical protein
MVLIDIDRLLQDASVDSFSAIAANILLGTKLEFDSSVLEKRLSGQLMLSILNDDYDGYSRACSKVESRSIREDADDWVYDDYLLFFCSYGQMKWGEGVAQRLIDYRLRRLKEDDKALQCQAALNGFEYRGPIKLILVHTLGVAEIDKASLLSLHGDIMGFLSSNSVSRIFDRIVAARALQIIDAFVALDRLPEEEYSLRVVDSVYANCRWHARSESILIFVVLAEAFIGFSILVFWDDSAVQEIIGKLSLLGFGAPLGLIIAFWAKRKSFISFRTSQLFRKIAGIDASTFDRYLKNDLKHGK